MDHVTFFDINAFIGFKLLSSYWKLPVTDQSYELIPGLARNFETILAKRRPQY